MRKAIFLIVGIFFITAASRAQERAYQYKSFIEQGARLVCTSRIILSSDHIFFQVKGCEGTTGIAKGRWEIYDGILTLECFDSVSCLPHEHVFYSRFSEPDSIRVSITDYYGLPCNIPLVVIYAGNDGKGIEDDIRNVPNGVVTLLRRPANAIELQCAFYAADRNSPGIDTVTTTANDVHISIDYPVGAAPEGTVFVQPFAGKTIKYVMKDGHLYGYDAPGAILYDEEKPASKK